MADDTTTQGPDSTTDPGVAPQADPAAGDAPQSGSETAATPTPTRPRGRIIRRSRSSPPPQALPDPPAARTAPQGVGPHAMSVGRRARSEAEKLMIRVVATAGIIGISAAIAAIMHSAGSEGWLIGVVVSAVSVALTTVLWTSRRI